MKKVFIYAIFAIFTISLFPMNANSASHPIKTVAVMTDTGHRNGTNYLICGAAADIIATDIINRINMTGRMRAPLLGETMSQITQKNIPIFYMTLLNDYKYNYNVDFVNLKRVTKNIPADYILMVTSGMDVQSQFLKDTWWNKLNVPGMDPVRPTYKLSTLVTLIDKKTYSIVWQDLYLRDIEAHNYDLGIVQFSPSYAQLSKIKKYSKNMSEYVTNIVDKQVNPWILPPQEPKAIEVKSRFLNEGTKVYYPTVNGEVVKENFNEFKNEKQKQWNEFQEKRQHNKLQKIQNVNYTQPKTITNPATQTVTQQAETKPQLQIKQPIIQTEQTQQSAQIRPLNNIQSTQNSGILQQFQENRKLKQEQKQVEKLQKIEYKQQVQLKEEQLELIEKSRKDKQLYDSIKNNIDDVSNSLPAPVQSHLRYVLPVEEVQYENSVVQEDKPIKLRPKMINPDLYK